MGWWGSAGSEDVPHCSPRLLLFSPSVVNLGTPLSVGVQLLDAPPGQEVKGSVFLRNPKGGSCSPKKDFKLSSGDDFVLLSLEVTSTSTPAVSQVSLLHPIVCLFSNRQELVM